MGVTGGQPFGFDVGAKPGRGGAGIRGLDLGVRGMRVGGRRKLLVPPNLAYGDKVGWQACELLCCWELHGCWLLA